MSGNEYITDAQVVKRARAAVKIAIEKKKALGSPIVVYDSKTNKIYRVNDDGSRTVLSDGIGSGRYSERNNAKEEA